MLKIDNKKIRLRTKFIKQRRLIKNRGKKESEISQNLCNILSSINLVISLYLSVRHEADLKKIAKVLYLNKKEVVLPVIKDSNSHLLFAKWKFGDELQKDKYNIKIPKKNIFLEPKILLIPMVAFDSKKNRLGYGGGFYDRTISFLEKKNKILKFGIAFDEQESSKIPVNKFDKKMDAIFTQSRIII